MNLSTSPHQCHCGCGETPRPGNYFILGHNARRPASTEPGPNPSGKCLCGCGGSTAISLHTRSKRGDIRGTPVKYIRGHATARTGTQYEIDPISGCWMWLLSTSTSGYAVRGSQRMHRTFYVAANGPIPPGYHVHHTCEERSCVNPSHLEALSPSAHFRAATQNQIAAYSERTHCKNGHPFDADNTAHRKDSNGARRCRACAQKSQEGYKLRLWFDDLLKLLKEEE